LIAGTTGSGKSTLQRVMLASMLACTFPQDLEVLLVDLKNEDLIPFRAAPHVRAYAGDLDSAAQVLGYMFEELHKRIANNSGRRILAVLDEIALLNFGDARIMNEWLPQIVSMGRSKRIHVWAATQHPLASIVGSVLKANFPVRLVGKVTDATASNVATGISGTGMKGRDAHLLPGAGAFLCVRDGRATSMQAYNMDADEAAALVQRIVRRDGAQALPSIVVKPAAVGKGKTTQNGQNQAVLEAESQTVPQTATETIAQTDDETGQTGLLPYVKPATREAVRLCQLVYKTKGSKNQAITALWPNRNKVTCLAWLNEALSIDLCIQKVTA